MKDEILNNLDQPKQLEKLYRDNKTAFKTAFNLVFQDIKANQSAQIWNERLNYENEEISWGSNRELVFVIALAFIAGILAKLPEFLNIDDEFYYSRNIAFIVFPILMAYFSWRLKIELKKIAIVFAVIIFSILYINLLPDNSSSDTIILASIHLPLFIWAIFGFTYVGNELRNKQKRLEFLRFNGELVVLTTIILFAGIILTLLTFGLFEMINISIEDFYIEYIVVWGLAASPIVGTYLVQTNPQLVNKVSPIIAKVFTPLVLITLVVYLGAIVKSGKDPYNDRDFLLIFNILLIGVMAIILFSIAGTSKNSKKSIGSWLLLILAILTVLVNGVALSAILFRISEWGITPNRLAVLGGNILILSNLLIVSYQLFKSIKNNTEKENVENSIATFLPIYSIWTIIVIFIFPLIFNFK